MRNITPTYLQVLAHAEMQDAMTALPVPLLRVRMAKIILRLIW
jgi:hypothetical protein